MNDTVYAEKQGYKVLIRAPIETAWSELVEKDAKAWLRKAWADA